MPIYKYSGKTLEGRQADGTMLARDAADLARRLIDKGVFVHSHALTFSKLQQQFIRVFNQSELTRLTRQLQILLSNGVPLLESFELAGEQSKNKLLSEMLKNVSSWMESGQSVAAAFGEYPIVFNELYISLISAGELSGQLSSTFDQIALHLEKSEALTKKVRSALAYPSLVVIVALLVMFAIVVYIVPVFSSMYENFGAELPPLTKGVIGISAFLKTNIIWMLLVSLIAFLSIILTSQSKSLKLLQHKSFIRLPLMRNLTTKLISVRFCRTMGRLLKSGVDIITSVNIASQTTGNTYLSKLLETAQFNLSQGKSFTESIAFASVFPKTMLRLTASGEKTGRLAEMLLQAADYYEKETELEMNILTTLLEPVIIVLLGIFIAFILIAMYLPLFELAVKM